MVSMVAKLAVLVRSRLSRIITFSGRRFWRGGDPYFSFSAIGVFDRAEVVVKDVRIAGVFAASEVVMFVCS